MNFEYASNFTIFVLVVSIILSFTLRKLIQDIQSLKEGLMLDLSSFTRELVEDHPTLEKYRKMALMYFRHEMFEQALSYFEHLIHERVFIREARYYKVICLMRLKRNSEASEVYEKLDLGQYSSEEVHLMRASFAKAESIDSLERCAFADTTHQCPFSVFTAGDRSQHARGRNRASDYFITDSIFAGCFRS